MSRCQSDRRGASTLGVLLLTATLVLGIAVTLLIMSTRPPSDAEQGSELLVYCAAGMRYPMEQIVDDYLQECGVNVVVQYGGSNTLLSQIEASKTGDLYLAADSSYIALAKRKGLAAEVLPLATMHPVIAMREDAARQFSSVAELLQPGVRVACGNPDAAAVGKMTRELLEKSGQWDQLNRQIDESGVFKPTVNEVANDVKLGSVDAGIVWDATAAQYPDLKYVRAAELEGGKSTVDLTVLTSSANPTAALQFARYVAACDRGLQEFAKTHFDVVDGDTWEQVPEITFFAGSVNRRALEPIIQQFEQREGVRVNTIYNGCGILTGQMRVLAEKKDRGFPDTYMACDVYYLETVKDWFQEAVNVSDTDIVIAVQKGNPKQIGTLADLLKPGMRVAIGQPDQCTIGVLTRRLLEREGMYQQLLDDNVVTQTATSALLVPAVTSKSADAALAYRTDTLAESDKVDVITLDSELSKAIQPFSIAKSSRQKHLARRLFAAIGRSRGAFESAGFHWRLADDGPDSDQDQPAESSETQ